MKKILLLFLVFYSFTFCSKPKDNPEDKNITATAVVWNETKTTTSTQEYWRVGLIFNKPIVTTGTAIITWYFGAGHLVGNPSNRFRDTLNINLTSDTVSSGYFEFTNYAVHHSYWADSVRLEYIYLEGDYNITKLN